ncbi:DUF4302 domain-containing protein [Marinifilum flexuosum]|uniref:Uncharacterized protein DUF4302 n=1 Tax=Marinifilum flexuosum TaxID=1117708 RepID=A0A419X9U8_9BACT|nr:DUF4302 domain-containing protein [Marinifilum flexuosum]RKE04329.1 uncharacterized protein DUF4302 [Marinifilum flexuosum]
MNKILYLLLVLCVFSSCDQDFEEVFDKNPTERKNEAKAELTNVLANAEHGWKTILVVGDKVKAGDFFLFDFVPVEGQNNGEVTVANPFDSSTSEFEIRSENGTVLSFNSWNEVFYWLVTPNGWEPGGVGSDLEFVYVKEENGKLFFRGKAKDIEMVLEPATAEDWDTTAIQEQFANFRARFNTNFTGIRLTKGMGATEETPFVSVFFDAFISNSSLGFPEKKDFFYGIKYWTGEKRHETAEASFVFTKDGIVLANPLVIEGDTLSKLTYNADLDTWEVADEGLEGEVVSSDLPIHSHPNATDYLFEVLKTTYNKSWYFSPWSDSWSGKFTEILGPIYDGPVVNYVQLGAEYTSPEGEVYGPGILLKGSVWGTSAYLPVEVIKNGESEFRLEWTGEIISDIEGVEDFINTDANMKQILEMLFNETGWSLALDIFEYPDGSKIYDYEMYYMPDPSYRFYASF